ncbi:MAG: hypothetical protein SAK29_08230 [Scytonema sp. PMC 1069.18]|nr:hypothetical protein [Scytonema sp. PMC 1069.18]MEC4885530.1 hypothetical protein [Scytonema sp. PMC 1070.18]
MTIQTNQHEDNKTSGKNPSVELDINLFILKLKNGVWLLGIPSWIFGITDRSLAACADGYLSPVEILHLLTTSFFFLTWLYLKPESSLNAKDGEILICPAQTRSWDLQSRHIIGQEYILPFPYICQIYHLLNLKHLETIHKCSLNNLKVINVSKIKPTSIGGTISFQTILDSPINILRMWREPIAEVDLILHTPYTVELSIPVYQNKRITVIFIAHPLTDNEHYFFIDIYSDLEWPKPLMQILLHLASCITLFEDLPYLRKLSQKNIGSLVSRNKVSDRDTMWLYNRFVELHGSSVEMPQLEGVGCRV